MTTLMARVVRYLIVMACPFFERTPTVRQGLADINARTPAKFRPAPACGRQRKQLAVRASYLLMPLVPAR
jgi:hypothetical protein